MATAREVLTRLFNEAIKAVDPYALAADYAEDVRSYFLRLGCRKLVVAGFGKAACPMAMAVEDRLDDLLHGGVVITKYGHCVAYTLKRIRMIEAGHPVPDENGLRGAEEIIRVLRQADEQTLALFLVSGGGSSLLVAPSDGISLEDKKQVTGLLLESGAEIQELNTVRKHISRVKGGRLAESAYPAAVMSVILSDVLGDGLDVIASGPTAPDPTTYADALSVLKKYRLADKIPESVLGTLSGGMEGRIPETPKPGNAVFERVNNVIIGNNREALEAALSATAVLGLSGEIISGTIRGEAREVGKSLAERVRCVLHEQDKRPRCLISGGETTVTVRGSGLGGRNMELALSFAMEIEGMDGITLLSAGTDGTDGPTDAAGAIVEGGTVARARELGLDPAAHLENNDSYNFFRQAGGLFVTGPTGTNVMDIQILLIE